MLLTILLLAGLGYIFPSDNKEQSAPKTSDNVKKPAVLVVELRQGGSLMVQLHPWRIRVYANGVVRQPNTEKRVPVSEVKRLLRSLERLGFFKAGTTDLTNQLRAAGELVKIVEGGHGVTTLVGFRNGRPHQVEVSNLEMYSRTSVRAVAQFRKAVEAVQKIASESPTH